MTNATLNTVDLTTEKKPTLESLRNLANRAYAGISFSPERRGDSIVKDYSDELDKDMADIVEAYKKNGLADTEIEENCRDYKTRYVRLLSSYLGSQSNCYSPMITGPARFPVAKMEKRNRWAQNKYTAFRQWRERALKSIFRQAKANVDPLEKCKAELEKCMKLQTIYVGANKLVRKYLTEPEKGAKLIAEQYHIENPAELFKPDYAGRIGYPSFMLRNNNANIARLKIRVAELEKKSELAETVGTKTITVAGVDVCYNHEIDRLQLLFAGKPAPEVITKLKKNAFRWSPTNKAWQRQLTRAAEYAACNVLGVEKLQ